MPHYSKGFTNHFKTIELLNMFTKFFIAKVMQNEKKMWLVKHYNEIEIHTKYLYKDLQTTAGQSKFLMHLLKFLIKKC